MEEKGTASRDDRRENNGRKRSQRMLRVVFSLEYLVGVLGCLKASLVRGARRAKLGQDGRRFVWFALGSLGSFKSRMDHVLAATYPFWSAR